MPARKALLIGVFVFTIIAAVQLARGGSYPQQQEQPPKKAPRSRVPDTFTNLQVLPKDIAKADLVRVMRQFSLTMDQNCNYCHVATDDLAQADFAADDKETKKKARDLLKFILETQKKPAASSGGM